MLVSRRRLLVAAGALGAGSLLVRLPARAADEMVTHGLSSFGDLKLPAGFTRFDYADPDARKGGTLAMTVSQTSGNQAFDTFNTLNMFTLRGQGAFGMPLTFDTLMASSLDEPDACYGLVANAVGVSADKLTYRFHLRPEARFHDGSPLSAEDVAFSLTVLRDRGHPTFMLILAGMVTAEAEAPDIVRVTLAPTRARDLHLSIAQMPIFSKAYWASRDFEASTLEAPLGSGPYRVGRFEQGRYIEYDRVADYWGRDLPVNVGMNNFDHVRYEYFRDRQVAFEAFKSGLLTFQVENTSRLWATGYDFPAVRDGRVKKESIDSDLPVSAQGWRFNLRRKQFKDIRIRRALGLAFDFEWTNTSIMYSSYRRTTSYFENSDMKATGLPSPQELALLEPFRDSLPDTVFGEAYVPPVSNGSGQDRELMRQADALLTAAGCKREGKVRLLPDGSPFSIEFLDFSPALQPHTEPFIANLRRLGIDARMRIVDAAQFQQRLNNFDFDIISLNAGGATTPGDSLRLVYGSAAADTPGSINYCGIANPAVDAMIEKIVAATSRDQLNLACRALDRILRAEHYWIPMWYLGTTRIAYWDMYARPQRRPRFDSGAPMTWWYDPDKARRIGRA